MKKITKSFLKDSFFKFQTFFLYLVISLQISMLFLQPKNLKLIKKAINANQKDRKISKLITLILSIISFLNLNCNMVLKINILFRFFLRLLLYLLYHIKFRLFISFIIMKIRLYNILIRHLDLIFFLILLFQAQLDLLTIFNQYMFGRLYNLKKELDLLFLFCMYLCI